MNYLRWDVIYRGPGDDWGVQDVEAPHVRIVDMHPVQRAEGLVILGELLNEDVVPAYVSVTATLLSKNQTPIATEGSFDKISHILLPKQVTPFFIMFPNVALSDVGSVRMTPTSSLVSASADPVIEIDNEHLNPAPDATLTGQLINQSGQIVNVAHVLGTFYDKTGQVVWVADQFVDRALLPQTPVPFDDSHSGGSREKDQQRAHGGCVLQFRRFPVRRAMAISARRSGDRRAADRVCTSDGMQPARQSSKPGMPSRFRCTGSGNATLYIVGPEQVLKRDVQLGEASIFPAGSLYNAGHYLVFLQEPNPPPRAAHLMCCLQRSLRI